MKYDFFISYTKKDVEWARWIGWILEDNNYKVIFQDWDFVPGNNFASQMDDALRQSEKTIIILSNAYLESIYARAEWLSVFADDPIGTGCKLIPVRIEECAVQTGLLKQIVYIDLVGLDDEVVAKERLLEKVSGNRQKPTIPPAFPKKKVDNGDSKKELLSLLIQNKAISIREDRNIKCIYELGNGYFTNIDIRYDVIMQTKTVFDAIVRRIRNYINPSIDNMVSPQCLYINNTIENKFLNDISAALGLSQNNWRYDMKQIVIIGTSTRQVLDQIMRKIAYLGTVIIIFGPTDEELHSYNKQSHKIKTVLSPKDLLLLSDTERWYIVNDR